MQLEQNYAKLTPYKSNFLQELESILNEKTADIENALKMNGGTINAGGISLHEMQILVKEATQRCKEAGYDFVSYFCNKLCIRIVIQSCYCVIFHAKNE